MDISQPLPQNGMMPFGLRLMTPEDVPQAVAMEKDAFPEVKYPTAFAREIRNPTARYLVALRHRDQPSPPRTSPPIVRDEHQRSFFQGMLQRLGKLNPGRVTTEETDQVLIGYVSIWFMADDAHITSVGVLNQYRGYGVGELLLIGAIEAAIQRNSRLVTLEVRVSNTVAQSLYSKYGFSQEGLRKRYYIDNDEDAQIMNTGDICSHEYGEKLSALIRAHQDRWGETIRIIS